MAGEQSGDLRAPGRPGTPDERAAREAEAAAKYRRGMLTEGVEGKQGADFRGTDVEFGLAAKRWGEEDVAALNAKANGFGDLISVLREKGFVVGEDGGLDEVTFSSDWLRSNRWDPEAAAIVVGRAKNPLSALAGMIDAIRGLGKPKPDSRLGPEAIAKAAQSRVDTATRIF